MKLVFIKEAEQEFLQTLRYYHAVDRTLGRRFKDEFERGSRWILDHPELFRVRPNKYRRINLRSFPYYIAYTARSENLWIIAVAHAARKPDYWINRGKSIQG